MTISDSGRMQASVVTVISTLLIFVASGALAAIVSGSFTTGVSKNVTITNLTIFRPASTVEGELLLASITLSAGNSQEVTAPDGWNLIQRTNQGTNVSIVSYWKVASDVEPTEYSWTITPQTKAVGGITQYAGVDPENPIDVSGGAAGVGKVATAPSVTTTVEGAKLITLFAIGNALAKGNHFSVPSGMTEIYDIANAPLGPALALDEAVQASAVTTGSKSSNLGPQKRSWVAQQIALRPAEAVTIPTPVAYWKLDGDSTDAVGSNDGDDTAIIYATGEGKINQGAGFDGSTSKINIGPVLSGSINISVAAWVRTSGGGLIVAQRNSDPQNGQWQLRIGGDSTGASGKITFYTEGGGNTNSPIEMPYGNSTITDGNWHHIGVSQNGATYSFYLDGELDGSDTAGTVVSYDGALVGGIGYDRRDSVDYFSGSLDEIGVWNISLSAADFAALYNAGAGRQYPF